MSPAGSAFLEARGSRGGAESRTWVGVGVGLEGRGQRREEEESRGRTETMEEES